MPKTHHYDYIIAGGGAAGLSLASRFCNSSFRKKKILLIDATLEPDDSKTWCFWDRADSEQDPNVCRKWNCLEATAGGDLEKFTLHHYTYNAVQSRVFSQKIIKECQKNDHIQLLEGSIKKIIGSDKDSSQKAAVIVGEKKYTAKWIFQSCFTKTIKEPAYPVSQHFVGWDITAKQNVFDEMSVTLMDFDSQYNKHGVAFMYILPWSKREALFEYTIFSAKPEPTTFYEDKIQEYVHDRYQLTPADYEIHRKEKGAIPMEDRTYDPWYATHVLSIGFASGISKPSTGYTFKNIQRQADKLTDQLLRGEPPSASPKSPFRFRSYDLLLLSILYNEPTDKILSIFSEMFNHNSMDLILKFLDNQTNLIEDAAILSSVPYWPFIKNIFTNFRQLLDGSY